MNILRTPDDRFVDLPGFPFGAKYLEDLPGTNGCRVHLSNIISLPNEQSLTIILHSIFPEIF